MLDSSIEHHHKKEHFKQSTPLDIIEAEDYPPTTHNDNGSSSSSQQQQQQQQHESSIFHNIQSLVIRNIDNSDSNSGAGGGSLSVHSKHSNEKNYLIPTPPPTPFPILASTEEDTVYHSLRDYHSSNSNSNGDTSSISHAKYSQEKNALNPNDLPDEWIARTPSISPISNNSSPPPTEDIRRVNPYITNNGAANDAGGEGEGEHCKASNTGIYFDTTNNGSSSRSTDNGIVLRYQYELIKHFPNAKEEEKEEEERLINNDILPKLEVEISNVLIPIFFHDCLNHNNGNNDSGGGGGNNRASLRQRELTTANKNANDQHHEKESRIFLPKHDDYNDEKRSIRKRRRRVSNINNKVIGIDALPRDFPLSQQECGSTSSSSKAASCHHIEGALTLYLPPNYATSSSILSSITLSTLRTIEQHMLNGSLVRDLQLSSENGIQLKFLTSSYDLHSLQQEYTSPTATATTTISSDTVLNGTPLSSSTTTSFGMILLTTILPLFIIICLFITSCGGYILCKRHQVKIEYEKKKKRNNESSSSTGLAKKTKKKKNRRASDESSSRRRSSLSRSSLLLSDLEEQDGEEGTTSDDDESTSSSEEEEESSSSSSSEDSDEERDTFPTTSPLSPQSNNTHLILPSYETTSNYGGSSSVSIASNDSSRSSRKNALNPIFENARHEKERKRKAKRRRERMRRRYIRHLNSSINENDDDVGSVATGMHSVSSQVTTQVVNNTKSSSAGDDGTSDDDNDCGVTRAVVV